MNIHIELVKKWLADPKSVSKEALKANVDGAPADAPAAYWAAYWANIGSYGSATYWVEQYEELTNE